MTAAKATKVTISVPHALFARLEQERRDRGISRSELIATLYQEHLRRADEEARAARYAAAYAKYPEGEDDLAWVGDVGAATLAAIAEEDPHDWSEDYRLDCELRAAG